MGTALLDVEIMKIGLTERKINAILNSIFIFFSIIYKIKQMEDKDDV